jgi:hypothetical protein
MGDLLPLSIAILLEAAVSATITLWLLDRRAYWPVPRMVMIAAAPVSVPLALLCVAVFTAMMLMPPEKCGVDACGMGAMAAMTVFIGALILWIVGVLVSLLVIRLLRR